MSHPVILHIEDSRSNRKVVRHILRLTDWELREACDGHSGLQALAEDPPDLVLLDLQLPGVSGYEIVRRIRADDRWRHIPVVAVTAYALSGDREKALNAGCDDYLAKPFEPQALLDCITRILKPPAHADP